jgi:hypothetical protein
MENLFALGWITAVLLCPEINSRMKKYFCIEVDYSSFYQ